MVLRYSQKIAVKLMALLLSFFFFIAAIFVQQPVNAESSIDTSAPVQLKWYVPILGHADFDSVKKAINSYVKSKINATVDITAIPLADYENKMRLILAAGEPYDICFTSSWSLNYHSISNMDLYTDITDMLGTYAPKTKALLGDKILKGAEVKGKIYAIPTYTNTIVYSNGLLLNKKLVQKYKVDTSKIKNLADLEPVLKNIKAKEPKVIDFYPFDEFGHSSVYNTLNYDKLSDAGILPGAVLRDGKSTKVINDYETNDAKSLFTLMNKWYKKGYISKSAAADSNYFNKNKSNIFALYSTLYSNTCEDLSISKNVNMVSVELSKPIINTYNVTSSMQAVSSSSKSPERALMFLELVNTDEKLSNMLNYGIEGVHYKKAGTKTVTQLPAAFENYMPYSDWIFGNGSVVYSIQGDTPKYWDRVKKNIDRAPVSPLLGFTVDETAVQDQITKLTSITNKYYNDLCIGKIDPAASLPKMNAELKKAGLQKVLDEMQKQVDVFVKAESVNQK